MVFAGLWYSQTVMVGFLKILYVNHSKYNTILYLKVDCKKNYIYIFGLNPGPNNFHQLLYLQLHTNSFMGTFYSWKDLNSI